MKPQILDLFSTTPSFSNFISITNKYVVDALVSEKNQFMHITGVKYNGKTHLLKAWINRAKNEHKSAIYIDAQKTNSNEIRQLATYYQLIAIDNIEFLDKDCQVELFDLFNSIKLNNRDNQLLTSSKFPLDSIKDFREDLKTRILSGLNLSLKSPDDNELLQIIKQYITQEGIKVNDSELNYIVTHYTRNIGAIITTINLIANKATIEKRNITIPLIRQILNEHNINTLDA